VRSGSARGRGTAPLTAKTSLTFSRNFAGKNLGKGSQGGVERCPYTCALQTATRGTGASTALRIRGTLSGSAGSSCPTARITTSAKSVSRWNAEGPAATSRYRQAPEGGAPSSSRSRERGAHDQYWACGTNPPPTPKEAKVHSNGRQGPDCSSLREIIAAPGTSGKALEAKAAAARQLAQITESAVQDEPTEAPPALTKRERKAVQEAMHWYPLMEVWDEDQVELCVRLGLITREEYEQHMRGITEGLPRPYRPPEDDLSRRRKKRAG
jgi:hypothetical protein